MMYTICKYYTLVHFILEYIYSHSGKLHIILFVPEKKESVYKLLILTRLLAQNVAKCLFDGIVMLNSEKLQKMSFWHSFV